MQHWCSWSMLPLLASKRGITQLESQLRLWILNYFLLAHVRQFEITAMRGFTIICYANPDTQSTYCVCVGGLWVQLESLLTDQEFVRSYCTCVWHMPGTFHSNLIVVTLHIQSVHTVFPRLYVAPPSSGLGHIVLLSSSVLCLIVCRNPFFTL